MLLIACAWIVHVYSQLSLCREQEDRARMDGVKMDGARMDGVRMLVSKLSACAVHVMVTNFTHSQRVMRRMFVCMFMACQ